jgi:methionyl-tRNA formyltransferase
MRVEREMDAGAVALVRSTAIGADEDAGSLEARLSALAAEAIALALDRLDAGTATWTPHTVKTFHISFSYSINLINQLQYNIVN